MMNPERAFEKVQKEWTPGAIQRAYLNGGNRSLAKIIYEEQSKYIGPNHADFCEYVLKYFFDARQPLNGFYENSRILFWIKELRNTFLCDANTKDYDELDALIEWMEVNQ